MLDLFGGPILRSHAKFHADPTLLPRYRKFWISEDDGCRHFGLLKLKFVTVKTVKRVELRHRAKFRGNCMKLGRDMVIFRKSKMAAAAILDFRNFKFVTVGYVRRVELIHCAKFR